MRDANDLLIENADAVREAFDRAPSYMNGATPQQTQRLLWLDQIRLDPSTNYIVKGLLYRGDFGVLFGPSGVGKTFFYTDLAFHILHGKPWFGLKVRPGGVLIVALEGQRGIKNRLLAQQSETERTLADGRRVPLALWLAPVDFCQASSKDAQLLVKTIEREFPEPPALIVVDTLARAIVGDENNSNIMTGFVRSVGFIQERTGAHVLVVHHTGKDADRGPRGHSSLRGAADTLIEIERFDQTSTSIAKLVKQKDGPEGQEFPFTLRQVEIGADDEGDGITSCIVVPSEAVGMGRKTEPKGQAGIALKALRQAISECGEPAPPSHHIPRTKVVRISLWERYCGQLKLTETDVKADSFDRAFRRARQELQIREIIGVWSDFVWLA